MAEQDIPISAISEGRYDHRRVDVTTTVTLKGYCLIGETKADARARMILWAEQRINQQADLRAHFTAPE